ncbi:hypothetical protein BKA70DRAFT_1219679 [Coprinopsis sp. MPI-PUGE-AT-0042]|nr:hypothetical protein BKA70DRAFT_1219679 [Coprinopsis sp. MPI-PUGE-AT-0042]
MRFTVAAVLAAIALASSTALALSNEDHNGALTARELAEIDEMFEREFDPADFDLEAREPLSRGGGRSSSHGGRGSGSSGRGGRVGALRSFDDEFDVELARRIVSNRLLGGGGGSRSRGGFFGNFNRVVNRRDLLDDDSVLELRRFPRRGGGGGGSGGRRSGFGIGGGGPVAGGIVGSLSAQGRSLQTDELD